MANHFHSQCNYLLNTYCIQSLYIFFSFSVLMGQKSVYPHHRHHHRYLIIIYTIGTLHLFAIFKLFEAHIYLHGFISFLQLATEIWILKDKVSCSR